jgi:sugar/nucleoside kinase (ribokinase family)
MAQRDQDAAHNAISGPDYTIWSQINVDEVVLPGETDPRVQLGGAATYAALGARLASPPERTVRVVGRVGADFEPEFWQWFADRGIDTSGLDVQDERTSRSSLVYGPEGERVEFPLLGEEHFRRLSLEVAAVPSVNLACRGLYVFREAQRGFWDELLAVTGISGAKVLWEMDRTSCRPACWADVSAVLKEVDVLSINHEEAALLLDCEDVSRCLATLRSSFEGALLYRMGANGSYVVEGERVLRVSAVRRGAVVDPTGAGNAYGGAFLAAWCEEVGLEEASRLAAGVAGLVIGEWGPPSGCGRQLALEARELASRTDVRELM